MGLQVQMPLFRWLQNLNLAKEGRRTPDNKIQLSEQIAMKIYDGVIVGLLIKDIVKLHPQQNLFDKLDAIKQNSTPAIRLYNWNILTEILKKLGLTLQYVQKSKILNLDPQPIDKVLKHLHKLYSQQNHQQQQKPLQVDITEVPKKQLKESNNILQFFVISISKNFKLSPQHTLNLFLDNNKYLAHLLVKGVKNSYDPIHALFSDISQNIDFIIVTLFCVDEKESVKFFFDAIKPALISKDLNVSETCVNILQQIHQTYSSNSMPLDNCKNWVKQQGLNTMYFAIKRHPILLGKIIQVIYLYIEQELFRTLDPGQKSVLWENETQKISFFSKLMFEVSIDTIKQFSKTKYFNNWIKIIVKLMKKSKQVNQINSLISVMGWLWDNLQSQFQTNQSGLPNAYLAFLKTCSLHQSDVIFINSIQMMFGLMEVLGNKKNSNAPFIYKILVNCFSFSGIPNRISFISNNFKQAFQTIKNLPGGPLVDPLVKSIEKSPTADALILCQILFEENRITQDQIIELVEVLSSIIFHDVQYGQFALDLIFDNINIMNEQMLEQFVQKNGKNALAHFYSVSASIKRNFNDLNSDYKRYGKQLENKKGQNPFIQQITKHTILGHLIKFIQKCLGESENVKSMLEPVLFYTYIRIKDQLKKKQQAQLLIPLMKIFYPAEDQLQDRINDFQVQLNPPKQQKKQPAYEEVHQQAPIYRSRVKNKSIMNKSLDLSEKPKTPKPLDSSMLRPSAYAVKDLEKIKKKIQQSRFNDQKLQKRRDVLQEKKQLFRSVINEKRIIEFGAKNRSNMQYKCIFEWDTAKQQNPNKMHGIPDIKLLNLKYDQQIPYTQDVDSTLKKYRKVWRFLFFKYSSFGAKQKQDFKSQQKINMAEVWKMLKQYDMMILKKQQSHALVRIINQAMKRKNDLQNLTYLGFQQYIFQMCNYGYNKSGYAHVPPGQKIQMMVKKLKDVTQSKGGNIQLYENPQEVYFQQTQVIRQFNRRLQQNPQYILPEGYKKVRMMELHYNYDIHPVNIQGFSSSYTDVLEVLDSILSGHKSLGFHIIEPLTHKVQKTLAKPSLFQNINDKMKDYKKGYLQPKQSPTTADIKAREKAISFKNQYHPHVKFSLGIKLGLAGVNIKNRFIADQVAYWMDDMLDAIEKGSEKVENKGQKKIDNDALKRKRASLQKMKFQQKQIEKKWKSRAESVKAKAQLDRQALKQQQKKKRQQRKKARIAQKQRQERQMKKKLEEFQQAKAKLEQKRKQQQNRRKQEQQKKKKQKQQYKKSVQEYFMKKKQELQQKQVAMKKAREDQKKKQIEDSEKKQQFAKKLHYNILKKQQSVLSKIQELKKGYDEIWTSKQIQQVFIRYNTPLKLLFDLLLKHQKSKISATNNDELSLNTLQFFALKFKIVPFMIQKNIIGKIFHGVGRTAQLHTGVDYNGFKEALFRISIKSKELLNDMAFNKKQSKIKKQTEGEVEDQISPSRIGSMSPKKQNLTQQYLYNTENVTDETIKQLIVFLNLPSEKLAMQQRYRQAIQYKGTKPRSVLHKQLRSSFE